jgi:hypothetical protein
MGARHVPSFSFSYDTIWDGNIVADIVGLSPACSKEKPGLYHLVSTISDPTNSSLFYIPILGLLADDDEIIIGLV